MLEIPDFVEVIVNVILLVSGVAASAIPLYKNVWEDVPINVKNMRVTEGRKLSTVGKWFVLAASLALISGIAKFTIDSESQTSAMNRELELVKGNGQLLAAHVRDSIAQVFRDSTCKKDAELNAANYQLELRRAQDSITKKLTYTESNINKNIENSTKATKAMFDSSKTNVEPLLDVHALILKDTIIDNPWISWDARSNSGLLNVIITNESTAYAYNLRVNYTLLWHVKHKDVLNMNYYDYYNQNCRFTSSDPVTVMSPSYQMIKLYDDISNSNRIVENLKYVAFEISYENGKGEKQKIIHKIYPIDKTKTNTLLPRISDFEVEHISRELTRLSYWH